MMEDQVLLLLKNNTHTIDGWPIYWSSKMVSNHLNISTWKARKALISLKLKGLIKYTYRVVPCNCYEFCECDPYPPIWGHIINN